MTEPQFEAAADEFARVAERATEELGATQPGDAALLDAMVEGVLATPAAVAGATGAAGAKGLWAILASLLVAGGVIAAVWAGSPAARRTIASAAPADSTAAAAATADPAEQGDGLLLEPASTPVESGALPPPEPSVPQAVQPAAATKPLELDARPSQKSKVVDDPDSDSDPATAAELLISANRASRAGKREQARRHYAELARRYPDSRERKVAQVGWGELELEAKRPAKALGHFKAYLSEDPKGNLAEEALHGKARALDALDRRDEGAEAWRALLDRFPSSVHAKAAERRLE